MLDSPHITLASEPLYTEFSATKILLLILKHLHWLSILLRSSSEVHSLLQVLLQLFCLLFSHILVLSVYNLDSNTYKLGNKRLES